MELTKTFVIVSVSSRVDSLNYLLETIADHIHDADQWDISVLFQDNLGNADKINKERITNLFIEPELMGCNGARIALLRKIKYDIYCNLDDDIEITPWTNYDKSIRKCLEFGTGFVLTNWARTESLVKAKVPKMRDAFVKQALIYQGGGMLYSDIIADLIRELPVKKTVFDEGWPLTAYLNGFTNYRYLGSLAIHRICTQGGMHEFFKSVDYETLATDFGEYIDYKRAKNGKWHIPLDADLKPLAKEIHKRNLKRKQSWTLK